MTPCDDRREDGGRGLGNDEDGNDMRQVAAAAVQGRDGGVGSRRATE